MSTTTGDAADDLGLIDIDGHHIQQNGWLLIGLMRSIGCPVCTLRHHELTNATQQLTDAGLRAPMVFISSPDDIHAAGTTSTPTLPIVADPDGRLHARFDARRSYAAVARGLAHQLIRNERRGKRLQHDRTPSETGHLAQLGADILLTPDSTIAAIHHWRWPGDHLPLDTAIHTIESAQS